MLPFQFLFVFLSPTVCHLQEYKKTHGVLVLAGTELHFLPAAAAFWI